MTKDILYPLRRLHGLYVEAGLRRKEIIYYKKLLKEKRKNNFRVVFLVLTPEHSNLGDHAIASEIIAVLKSNEIDYIEITGDKLDHFKVNRMLNVMNKTPILINGGGNLGSLWFDVEQIMRDVVKNNPKSPIFIMPNTIFYEDSDYGKSEFEKSKQLYNSHKKLTFYAREHISYDIMNNAYRNVKLMPDMVLFRNESGQRSQRSGCLLCLRSDLEKTVSDNERDVLFKQLERIFGKNILITDTHAKHKVPVENREEELNRKFDEFRGAELVVTDRLHGMIFCAITGTPCIVVNSRSPKLRGCFEWINDLDYVRFIDDVSKLLETYNDMPRANIQYDNSRFENYRDELSRDLRGLFKE